MKTRYIAVACTLLLFTIIGRAVSAQTITGAWKGKIGSLRTELKLIKKGDSLVGTSYYYTSKSNYRRYAVKGYFDGQTNNVVWWDDQLLEDRVSGRVAGLDRDALLAIADFNCPGEDEMRLEGESTERDNKHKTKGNVQLEKITASSFPDEWDFVIENYTAGANDPYIIDSIAKLSMATVGITVPTRNLESTTIQPVLEEAIQPDITVKPPMIADKKVPVPQTDTEKKFTSRKKKLATVIPVVGDSVEIRFYDNAVIDGDSIAVFLNGNLVFEHVRLTYKPYTIKLAVNELLDDNELVMVAENLGSIPPNTSLMVVMMGDKRYEARVESTEETSALVRFIKQE